MACRWIETRGVWRVLAGVLMVAVVGCTSPPPQTDANASAAPRTDAPIMDSLVLQAELMGFADRHAMIMAQALEDISGQDTPYDRRSTMQVDLVYGMSSMYSIAAEPNPEAGLLDMTVIVTLGRLVYEERYVAWGEAAAANLKAFRFAEEEIWAVARQVLTPQEEAEVREMVTEWHQAHPDHRQFVLLRFGDFAAQRQDSSLAKKAKSRGMFAAVHDVTEEVQQSRLLAERSMFLASRLPLLTGDFMELWLSRWLHNPEVTDLRLDLNALVDVVARLIDLGETLPDEVLDRVGAERQEIVTAVEAQEEQLGGLLSQAAEVVTDVNHVVVNADRLVSHFDPILTAETVAQFDPNTMQTLMIQTSALVGQLATLVDHVDQLVASPDSDKHMSTVVGLVDRFEMLTTRTMNYAFLLGVGFLVVVLLMLSAHRSLSRKIAVLGKGGGTNV